MRHARSAPAILIALAMVVCLCGSVFAVSIAEAQHGHDRAQLCAICQLAHLPSIQPEPHYSPDSPHRVFHAHVDLSAAYAIDRARLAEAARAPPSCFA